MSQSSESELESGGLIIADIIVLTTVPKNPKPNAERREVCF